MARAARPPVIAVMGHIDHGKSSLLDYIRKENIVAGEAGGITQHVAAYVAEHGGRKVTFLDTPGHEAFKALRARGAAAADIAILVVAADEGVMPQTNDALAAIAEAKIPFVVAITKIDKNNADVEMAKRSLLEHGVYLEGLGGEIPYAPVSSKTGEGVPELLDLVLLAADIIEPSADVTESASGFVLESSQDAKRGASATLIIKDGTLETSSFVIAGDAFAPVRFIEDFRGKRVKHAGPSEPAVISGFSKLPPAGTPFSVVKSKKEAESAATAAAGAHKGAAENVAPLGLAALPLVIKADVAGSIDAIKHELGKISHERAAIVILSDGVGDVAESDVKTAAAAGGSVIAFHVGADAQARELALRDSVPIESFTIIYELAEKVREALVSRAPKLEEEREQGRAKVLKTFSSGSKRQVVGARLLSGRFTLGDRVKLLRAGEVAGRGTIGNIQQARADIKEIAGEGAEFGAELESKEDAKPGDELVAFVVMES
ncbi:MAG: translation initiation factor IF-2 [Minisyncoccia bacterium]